MKVIFSDRAFSALLAETYEKIKTETGGIFLGYYENDTWYVVETIDPGPKSIFEVAYFEYDQKYVTHLINKIARLYRKNLSLLGLWHRHPGSFDVFSNTDDGTNLTYARMFPQGAISALVNIDPTFRLTVYHVSSPLKYTRIPYEVGNHLFPNGVLDLLTWEELLEDINGFYNKSYSQKRNAVEGNSKFAELMESLCKSIPEIDIEKYKEEFPALLNSEGLLDQMTEELYDDLEYFTVDLRLNLRLSKEKDYLCICEYNFGKESYVYFSKIPSLNQFVFFFHGKYYIYHSKMFRDLLSHQNDVGHSLDGTDNKLETSGRKKALEGFRSFMRKLFKKKGNGEEDND